MTTDREHGWFTTSDDVKIHYVIAGAEGSWVVLIHGYTASAEGNWFSNGIAHALSTHRRGWLSTPATTQRATNVEQLPISS